jgi:hypothetical protein
MGEGNAATKGAKGRTSDGGPDHHLRDGQQQEQKNKDDKKRKKITKHNHTIGWIREWLTLLTQLDGTGRHERLLQMA